MSLFPRSNDCRCRSVAVWTRPPATCSAYQRATTLPCHRGGRFDEKNSERSADLSHLCAFHGRHVAPGDSAFGYTPRRGLSLRQIVGPSRIHNGAEGGLHHPCDHSRTCDGRTRPPRRTDAQQPQEHCRSRTHRAGSGRCADRACRSFSSMPGRHVQLQSFTPGNVLASRRCRAMAVVTTHRGFTATGQSISSWYRTRTRRWRTELARPTACRRSP